MHATYLLWIDYSEPMPLLSWILRHFLTVNFLLEKQLLDFVFQYSVAKLAYKYPKEEVLTVVYGSIAGNCNEIHLYCAASRGISFNYNDLPAHLQIACSTRYSNTALNG